MNQIITRDLDFFYPVNAIYYTTLTFIWIKNYKNSCFKLFLYLSRKIEFGFVALCKENLVESLSSPHIFAVVCTLHPSFPRS